MNNIYTIPNSDCCRFWRSFVLFFADPEYLSCLKMLAHHVRFAKNSPETSAAKENPKRDFIIWLEAFSWHLGSGVRLYRVVWLVCVCVYCRCVYVCAISSTSLDVLLSWSQCDRWVTFIPVDRRSVQAREKKTKRKEIRKKHINFFFQFEWIKKKDLIWVELNFFLCYPPPLLRLTQN